MAPDQARGLFNQIMDGALTEAQTAGVLVALAAKGETVEEITGAARAMREHALKIETGGRDVIDVVGTGGTGLKTVNISTPAAMVVAGAGVPVAKHGNRTNTRPSGSADVLAALGVNLDADLDTVARCLKEAGMCFCFAVKHHPAMKHAVGVRRQLAVRTVFNILGPLTNPALAESQVLGVPSEELGAKMVQVLYRLGSKQAIVVYGLDGMDEISLAGSSRVWELRNGKITDYQISPQDFGLKAAGVETLAGGTPEENAAMLRSVLEGEKGPRRNAVVMNAAAGIVVGRGTQSPNGPAALKEGAAIAVEAIDSGKALDKLERLISLSQSYG